MALLDPSWDSTYLVAILRLGDAKMLRATHHFADPFEVPAWRSQWVERI